MTGRRWEVGMDFWVDNVRYRTVRGRKAPDDIRLDWYVAGDWHPVGMETPFLHTDFFFENEDVIYKPPYQGGRFFTRRLGVAAVLGYERAQEVLRFEQEAKRRRINNP